MESPKKLRKVNGSKIAVLLVMLGCTSVGAWSQDFETNVQGFAKACTKQKKYDNPTTGNITATCSNSSGFGSSVAMASFALTGVASSVTALNGYANAITTAFDIATLIPPDGYDKTEVDLTVSQAFVWQTTGPGYVYWCSYAGTIKSDCATFSSGKGSPTISKSVTVTKSSSGFQFPVKTIVETSVKSTKKTPFAQAIYGSAPDPTLTLQEGWTCTWASGSACP